MIVQFFFWTAIILFITMATVAAWKGGHILMTTALVLSLPSSLYLFGGNGWIQFVALYIPMSLGVSIILVKKKDRLTPKLLLLPTYAFYAYLGYAVVTQ